MLTHSNEQQPNRRDSSKMEILNIKQALNIPCFDSSTCMQIPQSYSGKTQIKEKKTQAGELPQVSQREWICILLHISAWSLGAALNEANGKRWVHSLFLGGCLSVHVVPHSLSVSHKRPSSCTSELGVYMLLIWSMQVVMAICMCTGQTRSRCRHEVMHDMIICIGMEAPFGTQECHKNQFLQK